MKTGVLIAAFLLMLSLVATAPGQNAPVDPKKAKWAENEYQEALEGLADADSVKRAIAVEKIRRIGLPKGAEALIRFAADEHQSYIVSLAAEAAVILDPAASFAITKQIVKGARGGQDRRRNLVLILTECPDESAGDLILDKFGDIQADEVQLAVIRSVGLRKPRKGVSYLRSALGAKDFELRNVAAIAAGRVASPELIAPLVANLESGDADHCKFSAWALNRIDDPSVFAEVYGRLGSASGVEGEAKAKVIEGSARKENVEDLLALLRRSKSREYREAAAIALGRLGKAGDLGELGADVQELLFARMIGDQKREVRGACWHALMRFADETLLPTLAKRKGQKDSELAKYVFHLIGHLKASDLAPILLHVMINERRDILLRYAAAINFWKAAEAKLIRALEERVGESSGQFLERGLEAMGFRRNPDGLRFLIGMLSVLRDGSREEYVCEQALQRMTGHFFGPHPGIWKKWFEKNPEFFTKKQAEIERNKWREEFDKENKGFRHTEQTEYAVQLALEFLARHQHPDGRFDPQRFYEMCNEEPKCKREGSRFQLDPVGTTALGVLAFTGAGYRPDFGKYKHTITRALEYLMAREQANGNFKTNDLVGGYTRPLGAQALSEALAITGDPQYGWYAQRSIDFLTTIQNKLGGWRYRVHIETTDTSCMSWNLFAMKMGQKAGLTVQDIAFAGCYRVMDIYSTPVKDVREDFIDIDPNYGFEVGRNTDYEFETGYQNPVWDTKYATVPLGIVCRIFLGWRRSHPFCIGSANKILADMMERIPPNEDWSKYVSLREYPTYAWYYGTVAMHQMGGRYFRLWNERIKKVVPGTQEKETCLRGSWPLWNHDVFGRVYTAAMGALTLETYYRYLPVLQD